MFVTTGLSIDRTILPWFARKCKDYLRFFALFFALFCSHEVLAETGKESVETLETSKTMTLENTAVEPLKEAAEASDVFTRTDGLLTKEELLTLILEAEKKHEIPLGLLKSIAHVESGHEQYYLNVAGRTIKAKSASKVLEIVKAELAKGNNNIDLGVMQVNLRWHGKEFESLKQMIEPIGNIEYAAKLLCNLKKQHGSWHKAVRYYHSATPEYHRKYSRKVLLSWLK